MPEDTIIRARISKDVKEKATHVLRHMGLTSSELIRQTFRHVAQQGTLPFDVSHTSSREEVKESKSSKE